MLKVIRVWFATCCLLLIGNVLAEQVSRIGVLSFQSKADTLAQWVPTAQALTRQLPGQRFDIVALTYEELDAAAQAGSVDFVFTNPEHYVVLRNRFHLRPMATLDTLVNGQVLNQFGSVIFTRSDSGITGLAGVRGKRIAAVSPNSLGGFLMAADTFRQSGVKLINNADVQVAFTDMPHSLAVQRVLDHEADVGIVRTGVLEQMLAKGILEPGALRVLNAHDGRTFPQQLSTDLYPEWPWAALPHVPGALVKAVTIALLQTPPDSEAARIGRYQGFSTPANYTPVEDLMRRLQVYPGMQERPPWQALWQDHPREITLAAMLALALGLTLSIYLWRNNRQLRKLTRINREAQTSLEVTAAAFNSEVALIVTDELTQIKRANPAMHFMLGYAERELIGKPTMALRGHTMSEGRMRELWATVQSEGRWHGELICRHRDGYDVPCMVSISQILDANARVSGFVGSFENIAERKIAEANIRQLAYYDTLTQLPNRLMFLEHLQVALDTALASGSLAGIMFIDMDHFKNLNDTHGHMVGDELLRLIARRLQLLLGPNDLAARLGGDEFVVMMPGLGSNEAAAVAQTMSMAETLHHALLSPYDLVAGGDLIDRTESLRYTCSGNIGVALFGLVNEPLTEVLKRADVAMYKSKQDGRNLIRQYDPSAQQALSERVALSNDLNLALREGQLRLLFQLQVGAHNEAVGAECLMRWHHPIHGLVSPVEFIPLAEDSGAIIAMGDWVIRTACETLVRWADQPTLNHLTLSVNVSPRQFSEPDFVSRVAQILAQTGANPELLRLEVTEGIVMQDTQLVIDRMQELCAMGLSFSIDDFGTGYSSMSYIQMLPLAELKIDKAFVNDLTSNRRSAAIVKAIIALGHSMDITIVSEGVETQAQKDQLLAMGCTLLQGYLISRPIECADLERLLTHANRPALTAG